MHKILVDTSEERCICDFRLLGFRDVLILGRYDYHEARLPLQIHDHGELMEICYLAEGKQFYRVAGKDYFLRGGDVLINYPHESHGTGFFCEGKGCLYWLILHPPDWQSEFLGMFSGNGKILYENFLRFPSRHFKLKAGTHKNLEMIFTLFENKNKDKSEKDSVCSDQTFEQMNSFFQMNVRNYLLRFFLDLAESGQSQHQTDISADIIRVVDRIKADEELFYTMKQLARVAGLSESRFKHRFREEVGTTPADYQIRHKIDRACQMLLRDRKTILDTALSLGFSSSQYFATVFRRYMGMSPAEYRNIMNSPEYREQK
ncbi:MAG: AraC family transcriptional regulator [Planctomycetaceae bacterium]|jgi:AraC-like DNA-binding protein|nr:AraC family transcriptional regulator [Planctomycetaceae bacterium]